MAMAGLALPPVFLAAWLLAVWPPPLWYRTHWPDATEFMRAKGRGATPAPSPTAGREERSSRCPFAPTPHLYCPVPLDSLDPDLIEAVLTAEDARFRTHGGIDWVEVRKALGYRRSRFDWSSSADLDDLRRALSGSSERRRVVRGASTITQQLAKNLYLSPSRNPLRKLKEAVTAYRLERALGKDRILELYVNVAELGHGVWGVEAASRRYFGTSASRLTLTQAAALAATLPFPGSSNPAYRPVRMRRRQDLILRRMRGERVEVPKVEEEPIPQPGDSIVWTPGVDSLMDSLRAPVETLFVGDTTGTGGRPSSDSGAVSP
jgi:monofunctional biosynthetic peptidoglycan transglycosylase